VSALRPHAEDPEFQRQWNEVKFKNKERLAATIANLTGVKVNPNALFDIQVKRIHEYKRQLLNVLGVVDRYMLIKSMTPEEKKKVVPRVVALGGKVRARRKEGM
jgi:starch phosphorylase